MIFGVLSSNCDKKSVLRVHNLQESRMHHSSVYALFVRLCTIRPFMHHSSVNALFVYLCIICPFMHQSTVYAPFGRLCTIRLFMHHLAVCASFGCLCTIRPFTKKWIASLAMYTWFWTKFEKESITLAPVIFHLL